MKEGKRGADMATRKENREKLLLAKQKELAKQKALNTLDGSDRRRETAIKCFLEEILQISGVTVPATIPAIIRNLGAGVISKHFRDDEAAASFINSF